MARNESDREDLYAEATAFVRRVELSPRENVGGGAAVVAGYRRNGVLTIYLSPDEMYQFTPAGELRRALLRDALFRTQGGTLAKLIRHRTPTATELLRHDLTADELAVFLSRTRERLAAFLLGLSDGDFLAVRQSPAEDVVSPLIQSLRAILASPLRLAPPLPTKRR
ncbi:MAG: hypothetical protein WEB58_17650 [Planctomycetaceae bacterium]